MSDRTHTPSATPDGREMLDIPGFTVYRGIHGSGTALPRHHHDDPSLCYVLRGRFTEYSAGMSMDCLSDTLKLTPAGETHWNRFASTETRGLRIDIDRSRFADSPAIHRLLDERLMLSGGHAGGILHRLVPELDLRDDLASVAVEGLLLELLAALARETIAATTSKVPRWLSEAVDIIRNSYASPIGLASIADAVGVSPATLARSHRSAFRLTIGERIRQLRVEHAANELVCGTASISSIALDAGFYDQSHFTNVFRKRFGLTPARYRLAASGRGGHGKSRAC